MEKNIKIFKTITIILLIVAVSLISFVGIYRSRLNYKENIIPDFLYGMDFAGNREFKFVLDTESEEKEVYIDEAGNYKGTVVNSDINSSSPVYLDTDEDVAQQDEEPIEEDVDIVAEEEVNKVKYATEKRTVRANEDNVSNKQSYEETKAIIQKRLEAAQIPEYNVRLNTITGDLALEIPEGDYTDYAYNLVSEQGKFEIIDSSTGVVLLNNSHIKSVTALYSYEDSYQAYLQIEFTDEGAEILKEVSKKYVKYTDETGAEVEKDVELKLDGSTLMTTYFGDELDQGILQITMGASTTNYHTFMSSFNSAQEFANILNFGSTPNKLTISSDNFVQSRITDDVIMYSKIAYIIVIALVSLVFILKYKLEGFISVFASIGYIAITFLVIRYTNVTITLNSIYAIIAITALNYVFMFDYLNKKKTDSPKHAFMESIKRLNIAIIPLWIVSVIFTFMTNITISSVGMILFWGLFIHFIYSFGVTRTLYI